MWTKRSRRFAAPNEKEANAMSNDATLRILQMVSEGKITAAEAERLLEAIAGARPEAKQISILVFEREREKPEIRINLPISFARFAMRFVPASVISKQEIPMDAILAALEEAQPGKVFDLKDESGKRVEIYLH